jgi:hypothetical protein
MALRALLATVAVVASSFATAASAPAASGLSIPAATLFGMRVVALHNQVRWSAGVQPITWDRNLAAAADTYAAQLASTGRWAHSAPAERPGQGENLWMGTHGSFSVDEMVDAWADEGRMFHAGAFPQVSKTGRWDDVGHYTQMIWPGSIRVGCAVRSSASTDYLVCRYSPAGNVMGSRILETAAVKSPPVKIARAPVTSNSILD